MANSGTIAIEPSSPDDAAAVYALYRRVAAIPGGLARLAHEVTPEYIAHALERATQGGLGLVARRNGLIVGEIHAARSPLFCFAHVLGDLTVAVSPDAQGQGIGARLFSRFMQIVATERPDVSRVELVARESNTHALHLYERLGFRAEGRMEGRIRNPDGSLEADIPMAWVRAGGS